MWHKFRSLGLRAQIITWIVVAIAAFASVGALAAPATKPASSTGPIPTTAPATFTVIPITPAPTVEPTPAPTAAPTPAPTAVPTAVPTVAATAVPRATAAPTVKAPVTPKPTAKPTTQAPVATAAPAVSCHPLSNAGNCYKPGQFCRDSDHLASGIGAGNEAIQCVNNNGWRWEPA